MIQIKKIDLSRTWNDADWDLFEKNNTRLTKTQFSSENVFEILQSNKVVGLLELNYFPKEKACIISEFEIQRNYRKQGLGKATVEEVISGSKQLECIEKIHVNPIDEGAESFWQKCGFKYYLNSEETMFYSIK